MAYQLIKVLSITLYKQCSRVSCTNNIILKTLRDNKIDFIVAPYEADAQLAYLDKIGFVDAVLTEDSDLVVFGCKKVIVKVRQ
jgi:5'-3' exonuclease